MGKAKKEESGVVPKSVTILPKHQRFIEDRSINLSKFLQKKLDEEIELQKWQDA